MPILFKLWYRVVTYQKTLLPKIVSKNFLFCHVLSKNRYYGVVLGPLSVNILVFATRLFKLIYISDNFSLKHWIFFYFNYMEI